MEYIATYHTDVGITKKTNQDSLAIRIIKMNEEQIAFAVVCDGMGGLAKGELASKEVTVAFMDWFEQTFLPIVERGEFQEVELVNQWNEIIQNQNKRLGEYGEENNLRLGTTVSALLLYKGFYYIAHVGDSRVYQLSDKVEQMTHDQTYIAREIAAGRMTPEQAKTDPRRSVLLQCVGASPVVQPEFLKGQILPDVVYMLCSDGFRHQISEEEILEKIGPANAREPEKMKYGCMYLAELVKSRKETDNISVALIRTI